MIRVVGMYVKCTGTSAVVVDTTSRSGQWAGLSPFLIGPCNLYAGAVAQNMENAWQYAKVYEKHADENGNPTDLYWAWAGDGWNNPRAVRYPMGRGAKPLYSLWEDQKLGYIEARKKIYAPLYAEAVQKSEAWENLKALYEAGHDIVLRDYDGYDHDVLKMTLTEVLNNPKRKMGHAFVLKMLLTNDQALTQISLRE